MGAQTRLLFTAKDNRSGNALKSIHSAGHQWEETVLFRLRGQENLFNNLWAGTSWWWRNHLTREQIAGSSTTTSRHSRILGGARILYQFQQTAVSDPLGYFVQANKIQDRDFLAWLNSQVRML